MARTEWTHLDVFRMAQLSLGLPDYEPSAADDRRYKERQAAYFVNASILRTVDDLADEALPDLWAGRTSSVTTLTNPTRYRFALNDDDLRIVDGTLVDNNGNLYRRLVRAELPTLISSREFQGKSQLFFTEGNNIILFSSKAPTSVQYYAIKRPALWDGSASNTIPELTTAAVRVLIMHTARYIAEAEASMRINGIADRFRVLASEEAQIVNLRYAPSGVHSTTRFPSAIDLRMMARKEQE